MCILLKLHYLKFGVSNLFFQKLSKKNLWRSARPPPPLVQEGLESCVEIMKTSISVARFLDFAVSSACCQNKMNNVLCYIIRESTFYICVPGCAYGGSNSNPKIWIH